MGSSPMSKNSSSEWRRDPWASLAGHTPIAEGTKAPTEPYAASCCDAHG